MIGVHNLEQPAKLWLADAIDNINALQNKGEDPVMDIIVFGVSFELRLKPEEEIEI